MSFSITKEGLRAEVAEDIRSGSHHVEGDASQFDQAREYIAAEIERTGTPEHYMSVSIAGHHTADFRSFSIGIQAMQPLLEATDVNP